MLLLNGQAESYRSEFKELAVKATGKKKDETNDTNFVFLTFVKDYIPAGLKGLLIAVIFLAAWGSIAAALNSLAASSVVDFHQRSVKNDKQINVYHMSRWYTLGWGLFSILIAQFSTALGQSLIEAVNVLGSLFYGVILGIFLVAFYLKQVKGTATFIAAFLVEIFIILLFFNEKIPALSFLPDISFLWMNAIGAVGVMLISLIIEKLIPKKL